MTWWSPPVQQPSRALVKSVRDIRPHLSGLWYDAGLRWDHEVCCASTERQDWRVGSCERRTVVVVDGGDAAVEVRRGSWWGIGILYGAVCVGRLDV
jgi:hypothetical protein